ncbi:hypothetical protein CFOL_v3_03605 [Cephalotus follicularis]|uniref:Uncharacterized protein n=1 Tax=Cephalotus follicularis TaxID=3775 RepID=A0A1Q3AWP7_CEPFO|nr:hypothetical protein CFOL_v3_03605 [Cephalotus follicularis]
MESSKHPVGTEESSSSESGWTMYINSPKQEDDPECSAAVDDDDNYENKESQKDDSEDHDKDSDDSMVSDASSGPSHHQRKPGNGKGKGKGARFVKDKGGNADMISSGTKPAGKREKKSANSKKIERRVVAESPK